MEADLLRFYPGIDLLDLGTPRLDWQRLAVLIEYLPRESATVRETVGDEARWGDGENLLATIVDAIAQLSWMFAKANFTGAPQRPKPLRRPGMRDPSRIGGKRSYTLAQVDRILATMTPKAGD